MQKKNTHNERDTKEETRVSRWEKTLQSDSAVGLFSSFRTLHLKVLTTIEEEVFMKQQ